MGRKTEQNNEGIVAAASRLFQERGFANTSLQDVAQACGVPKGNFYYHYRSKDDIVRAVIDYRLEALALELEAIDAANADPRKRLAQFTQDLLTHPDAPFALGCPHGSLGVELAKGRPDLLDEGRATLARLRAWFSDQFHRMGTRSNPNHLAMHLVSRIQGVLVVAATFQDAATNKRELREIQKWIAAQR